MAQGALNTRSTGFAPGNGVPGERKLDVSEKVFLLDPFNFPFVGLLTNIGRVTMDGGVSYKGYATKKRSVKDPVFYSFEDAYGADYESVGTGPTAIATTMTVVDATIYAPGDVIMLINAAGTTEQVIVTAASGTTLTMARGKDEVNAGTGVNFSGGSVQLFLLGSASAEGSTSRTAVSTAKTKVYNYTQIFKTSFEVTGTVDKTEFYTGNQMAWQNFKQAKEHALDIERQFWFGNRYEDISGSTPVRFTGGIVEAITAASSGAYVQNESASILTETEWNTFLKGGFGHGNTQKIMFASGTVLAAVSGFARGAIRSTSEDKTYGIAITQYKSPFGTVNLVQNPLFKNNYDGYGVMLDLDTVEYCYLNGRDTKLEQNVQANDADGRKDQFITECGLGRYNQAKNALLKGVTG